MAKRPIYRVDDFPAPGTIFLAPTKDGRFAAGRVLKRVIQGKSAIALVAATPWLGNESPSLDLATLNETLVLSHHMWKQHAERFWVLEPMPSDFQVLGQIELTAEDHEATSNTYGGWQSVPLQSFLQWRWDNDRQALLQDEAKEAAERMEESRKQAAIRAEYLRTLTLDSLVERNWLESWEDDDLVPLGESRSILSRLVIELMEVPKLTPAVAKRLLKQSVNEFNQLDTRSHFIGTIEREDICEAFEQIMCAARFPQVIDQVENWRDW